MNLSRWKIGLLALLAGAIGGYAYAQTTVVASTFSGSETFRAATQGPGSAEAWYQLAYVRNSEQSRTTSGSGAATSTGAGGTLIWTGTAPTTWAVTLPAAPAAGTIQRITTDTTLTTLVTVTAGSGDTMQATFNSQTLTANTTVAAWIYHQTNKVWYRIQ